MIGEQTFWGPEVDAAPDCPHGYTSGCPDCDAPAYLPAELPARPAITAASTGWEMLEALTEPIAGRPGWRRTPGGPTELYSARWL